MEKYRQPIDRYIMSKATHIQLYQPYNFVGGHIRIAFSQARFHEAVE